MRAIYRPGFAYAKAGIILGDLQSATAMTTDLFADPGNDAESEALMRTLDAIQVRYGKKAIGLGTAGLIEARQWAMRQGHRSPAYTTDWQGLAVVKVDHTG